MVNNSNFFTTINNKVVDVNDIFDGNMNHRTNQITEFHSTPNFTGSDSFTTWGGGPGYNEYVDAKIDMQRLSRFFFKPDNNRDITNYFCARYEDRDVSWNAKVNNSAGPWAKCIIVVAGGGGGGGGGGFFDDNDGASGGGGGSGGLIVGYVNNVSPDDSLRVTIGGGGGGVGENTNGYAGGTTEVEIGGSVRFQAHGGGGGGHGRDNEGKASGGPGGSTWYGSGAGLIYRQNGNNGSGGVAGDDDDNDMSNGSQDCAVAGAGSLLGAFGNNNGYGGNGGTYGNDDEFDGKNGTAGKKGWVRLYYLSDNI